MIEDIWKQSAKGFSKESIGRTEEQIVQKETEIGFKFPNLYREHLKIQNGGYLWKSALIHNGEVNELLYNGSTIDPIINHGGYNTLKDVLLEYMDKEELENSSEFKFLNLDRLPILSHMDGHTMLCFDYGYNLEKEYIEPQICYFELECAENGFEEKLRVNSYKELIENLVYYGYESTSSYIGLNSEKSIEEITEHFYEVYNERLELNEDDGYGWYNFKKWFSGKLDINNSLSLRLKLTPNQFLSKTYLLQNHKEYNYILEIDLRTGVESFGDNSDITKPIIEDKMKPLLDSFDWKFLLIPYNKENSGELIKLKKKINTTENDNPTEEKLPPTMPIVNKGFWHKIKGLFK